MKTNELSRLKIDGLGSRFDSFLVFTGPFEKKNEMGGFVKWTPEILRIFFQSEATTIK